MIDHILEQIEKEQLVDIPGAITKIRHKRMKMVQSVVSSPTHSLTHMVGPVISVAAQMVSRPPCLWLPWHLIEVPLSDVVMCKPEGR